jgi:endogenous inhibitor of DNA gyrase (YacG/DUF329 family)
MAKNDDVMECAHCGHDTKRINHQLELPSCCARCDKALYEEYTEGASE